MMAPLLQGLIEFTERMVHYPVACLRINSFKEKPEEKRDLITWLSIPDAMQLFLKAIETPDIHFTIAYGVSNNKRHKVSNEGSAIKDYHPVDDAENFVDTIAKQSSNNVVTDLRYGGILCDPNYRPN